MTYASKLQKVTTMYMKKCTDEPAFKNGKPSPQFWMVRGFFFKQDPDVVNIVYDFLEEKASNTPMSLYNVVDSAKSRQTELRWQEAKEKLKNSKFAEEAFSFNELMEM